VWMSPEDATIKERAVHAMRACDESMR